MTSRDTLASAFDALIQAIGPTSSRTRSAAVTLPSISVYPPYQLHTMDPSPAETATAPNRNDTGRECHFDRLPNELLVAVFKAGIQTMTSSTHFSLLVTKVTSRWRRVALAATELWNMISIDSEDALPIAQAFLERSKTYPLHVHISDHTYHPTLFRRAIAMLRPHLGRINSLEIDMSEDAIHACTLLMTAMSPSPVEYLRIHLYKTSFANVTDDLSPIFVSPESFPSLRSLNLRDTRLNLVSPYASLFRLVIQAFAPSISDMESLLRVCPALTVLILPGLSQTLQEKSDDKVPDPLLAPNLRSLAFSLLPEGDHHLSNSYHCALSFLKAPELEYLEVSGLLESPGCLHSLLDRKKHPKLRTLRLDHSLPFTDDHAFPAVPSLERLELVGMRDPLDGIAPVEMPGLFPFPKLSSLYFVPDGDWREEHYAWLRAVASIRAGAKSQFTIETAMLPEQEYGDTLQNLGENVTARIISPSTGLISFQDFTSFEVDNDEDDYEVGYLDEDPYEYGDLEDYDFGSDYDDPDEYDPYDDDDGLDMVYVG
jgi:hypothetical protein